MTPLIRRPVFAGVAIAATIGALGVVASIDAEVDARRQEADAATLVDRLELARHVDELATSTLNLAPELRDEDPIGEIAEDIDDERELAERQLATTDAGEADRDRLHALLDEAQAHVDAERFDLDPADAAHLSERLRTEASAIIGDARGVAIPDLDTAAVVATRREAAALMIHVVDAIVDGGELDAAMVAALADRLETLAGAEGASIFDPEVEIGLDDPGADVDTLDHLSELVVTMTLGLEHRAGEGHAAADRGAVVAYAAAFAIAVVSMVGLLAADRAARRRELAALRHAVGHDELTGAANRSQLQHAFVTMRPSRSRPLGVVYVDLDRFKPINDSFGHHVGDEVLRMVAKRMSESLRADDTVARIGGDEFVALISGPRTEVEIIAIAERVVARLNEPVTVDGQRIELGASGGATVVTSRGVELAEALRHADAALFAAKKAGRGQLLTSAALDPTERTPVSSAR